MESPHLAFHSSVGGHLGVSTSMLWTRVGKSLFQSLPSVLWGCVPVSEVPGSSLDGDVVDVNELHRGPHAPVHPQGRPERAPHLGSAGGSISALQEAHDEEEQQQEGRRKEEAVQQQPLDPGPGHVGRDPVLHEEVEEVAQRPREEEPINGISERPADIELLRAVSFFPLLNSLGQEVPKC